MVSNRHQRHDLAPVEKQSQRALRGNLGHHRRARLINARYCCREAGVVGIGMDLELFQRLAPDCNATLM